MSADWGAASWDETAEESTPLALVDADADALLSYAEWANLCHGQAQAHTHSALEAAWHAGVALLAAKELCRHGEWLPWLAANFAGSARTAQGYMRLASNTQHVADLDSEQSLRDALKALCKTSREPQPPDTGEEAPSPNEQQASPEPDDTEQASEPAPKSKPLAHEFRDDVEQLTVNVQALIEDIQDERFAKARNKIKSNYLDQLFDAIAELERIAKLVMGDIT